MKTVNKVSIGLLFCAVFLGLTTFGISVKVQTKLAPVSASTCTGSGPVKMKVQFNSVQNEPKTVRLTNGTTYGDNTAFDVTNADGSAINDPAIPMNILSLVANRSQGKVEFYIHNNKAEAKINATITIEGATFTGANPYVTGLVIPYGHGNTKLEVPPQTNANGASDALVVASSNTVNVYAHFNEPGDGWTVNFTPCTPEVIKCYSTADCGEHLPTAPAFCSGSSVYQNYRTWTCNNPGTASSSCSSVTVDEFRFACTSNQTCSGGTCVASPPKCTTDSDCGTDSFVGNISCQSNNVYQNYKEYTCENPGTAQANCTDDTTLKVKQLCAAAQACNTGGCYPEVW